MLHLLRTVSSRRLIEHPIRTVLTIVGIALGVAAFISVQMILTTIADSFSSMIDSVAGKAQLQIAGGETGVDDSIYDLLQAKGADGKLPVAGLKAALPTIQFVTKYGDEKMMILAVDTLNDKAARDYKMVGADGVEVTDPLEFLNSKDSLLLNQEFARKHELKLDQRIDLLTSQGRKSFVVRGYLEAKGAATAYGNALALMDIYSAQILFGKKGKFDTIDLVLEDGADPDVVAARVNEYLQGRFEVARPSQRNQGVDAMLYNLRQGLTIMSLVVLVMGAFIVYNTVTTLVYQRMREIGVLRMVGVTRVGIWLLFVLEAAVLGVLGSAVGLLGGYTLGHLTILHYLGSISNIFVPVSMSYAEFNAGMALRAAGIGLAASLVGGAWPAYRATRISPMEVVHFKPSLSLGRGAALGRWAAAAALCGAYVLFGLLSARMQNVPALQSVLLVMVVLGVAVTPLFMRGFLALLTRCTTLLKSPLPRMATDNVVRDLGRSAMSVAAFMVALAVMFEIYLFMNSTQTEIKTWMDDVLTADLLITSSSTFATQASVPISDEVTGKIAAVPGVSDVIQLRVFFKDFEGSRILLLGINYTDRVNVQRFRFSGKPDMKAIEAFTRDEGVFLSENLVGRHPSLRGATTIAFSTPKGKAELPVLGQIVDYTFETGTVLINRGLFVKTFQDDLVSTFHVYTKPGADIEAVRRGIESQLGDEFNLYVLTNREFKKSIMEAIDQLFALAVSLEILTLFIALLGIVNNLMANVIDRTREIGVIRSLGGTRAQIAGVYFIQSGLLGFSGAAVAAFIGYGLGWTHMTRLSRLLTGWRMGMHYSWALIGLIFVSAVIVAIAAGLFPARKAAGLPLREALKYE